MRHYISRTVKQLEEHHAEGCEQCALECAEQGMCLEHDRCRECSIEHMLDVEDAMRAIHGQHNAHVEAYCLQGWLAEFAPATDVPF